MSTGLRRLNCSELIREHDRACQPASQFPGKAVEVSMQDSHTPSREGKWTVRPFYCLTTSSGARMGTLVWVAAALVQVYQRRLYGQ